ncbi:MAG: flagellar basal body P-ring formation chaperone FlgA [Porticoccaceae bacterium]|nr:flagellar basal body P-ring formation chaperone FlgA [Porticoccaceae bacterium]
MLKPITVLCGLLVAIAASNPSTANAPQTPRDQAKQQLIDQVEEWVSATEDVERSRIRVGALDRRLIVPPCDADFTMSYPFASSTESIRVDCKGTGWKAFIRVRVKNASQGYAYKRDLNADHLLSAEDIELISIKGRQQGLIVKLEDIGNMSLKKSVQNGELVRRQHLSASINVIRLRVDVLTGETLTDNRMETVTRPMYKTTRAQRFPRRLLEGALAARDLAAGHILQSSDIKQRHRALIAQTTLARGQVLTPGNAQIVEYFGKLPSDAIISDSGLDQLEVTRTIQAGSLLRMSDVKAAALIKKGDTVTLSVGRGALLITVSMQALEGGKLGEQIQLLNPESSETVDAVVSGTRRARGL